MSKELTMGAPTREQLTELSGPQVAPCLSLYQPTHRTHPDNRQDPIRFRNLVAELERSLSGTWPEADVRTWLAPFEALAADDDFWQHTLEGLAVFGGPETFRVMKLAQPVSELVVVADGFHLRPLRQQLQSVDRYQILGLSLGAIRVFEGTQHGLDELELVAGVPRTVEDALGDELTEPYESVGSHGGSGAQSTPVRHGHGGKADEVDGDADRFFRAVDRAVMDHYSKPSGLPLVLAALPEHHHRFHAVSRNSRLITKGIEVNPDSVSLDELRDLAWRALEPGYELHLASLRDDYAHAESKGHGSDVMSEVATAAFNGRVATLLIEADRQIAGRLDATTGHIRPARPDDPHLDDLLEDLLDDLGALVTAKGGTVLVVPSVKMPSTTGLAATYRY